MNRLLDDRYPLTAARFFFFFPVENGNIVRENSENTGKSRNIRGSAKRKHSSCKLKSTNIFLLARMVSTKWRGEPNMAVAPQINSIVNCMHLY